MLLPYALIRTGLVATVVVTAVLGSGRPAAAVAHGEAVPDGRYAFSARVTSLGIPVAGGGTRDSWCSGALIASRWVVTAGHCFRDEDGTRVSRTTARETVVVVGRTDLTSRTGQEAHVTAVRQAPGTDIALVELDRDIDGVSPLALSRTEPSIGEVVRLTGYGLTRVGGRPPDSLRTGRVGVDAVGATTVEVSGRSPRRDTSACPHDSGAPYFREPEGGGPQLVAVVSGGPSCPHEGRDTAARVDTAADWIIATIGAAPGAGVQAYAEEAIAAAVLALAVLVVVLTRRRETAQRARFAHSRDEPSWSVPPSTGSVTDATVGTERARWRP
jgi:secreted trypsin-like serine protease